MKKADVDALREENLDILAAVLRDPGTSPAVKIQAVQAREKIITAMAEAEPETDGALTDVIKAMKG